MTYKFLNKYDYTTPLSVTSNEATVTYDSINLRRKVVRKNAQRFEFDISFSAGRGSTLNSDLMAHWLTYGMETPFYIDTPQPLYTEELTIGGLPIRSSAGYIASNSQIQIYSSAAFNIPAGRFITFSGHSKVYVVKETLSGTSGVLKIAPPLVSSIAQDEQIKITDVKALVLNEAENSVISYESGIMQTAKLKFVEHLG